MEDIGLVIDLFLSLAIALLGGMIARRLGMPVLIGYILAGIAIGPRLPVWLPMPTASSSWRTSAWSS